MPLLAGALAYAPAPWGELVWDDPVFVDFQLRFFHGLNDVFLPPDDITRWSYAYYRPLVVLSYLLDARLFGPGSPVGAHLANVVYHLATTGFVWLLLRRLLRHLPGGETGALLAAIWFAVHPVHTESVSWIAGRSDVLATLFLLPALLLALRWRDTGSITALLLAPLLYLLALMGKEVAITGLVLLPWVLILAQGGAYAGSKESRLKSLPQQSPGAGGSVGAASAATHPPVTPPPVGAASAATSWRAKVIPAWIAIGLAFIAAGAVYFWLRQAASMPPLEYQPLAWSERAWRTLQAAAYYIFKALVPWPQSAIVTWDMVPGRALSLLVALGAAVLAAGSAWRWRRGDGTLLLAAGWFAATIGLAIWTSVGPVTNTPLAERHLYLPSVGVALGLGAAFSPAWTGGWRVPAGVAAALVLVLYTAAAINRGLIWRTDYTLWADATEKARTDGLAWINFGLSQWSRGEDDDARTSFEHGLEDEALEAKFQARAHNGIGMIAAAAGDEKAAEENFRVAISIFPEFVEPFYRLASLYAGRAVRLQGEGRTAERNRAAEQAISNLATATVRYPDYHAARLKLAWFLETHGQAVEGDGDRDQAVRRYQAALDQLDTLLKRVAADPRARVLEKAVAEVQVDPADLRRRLDAHLARLQVASGDRG